MKATPATAAGPTPLAARIHAAVQAARHTAARFRTPIFALCAALFLGGLTYSASTLDLRLSDLEPGYIALTALVIIPLSMVYGALNFMIMARGAKVSVPFGRSLKISCVAAFAEFLPVPGGAIVRGGALMREGSGALDASLHVTINALLWIACSAIAAWLTLDMAHPVALSIGAGGVAGVAGCTAWLAMRAGWNIALAALAMRIVGLGIAGARIITAFLAIGVSVGFFEIYPFVFAAIMGSAASIAPGGLGISEIVAAAIATLSTIPPEAAFLAVGLNRIIGFGVSGIATGIIAQFPAADGEPGSSPTRRES